MAWQLFWTFWPLDRVHVSHLHFMLDYNTLLVVLKERIMEMCSGHTDKFSCIKCYPEKGYKKMGGNQNNTKIYCKESTSKAWKLHNGVRKENCERLILRFLAWLIGGMTMWLAEMVIWRNRGRLCELFLNDYLWQNLLKNAKTFNWLNIFPPVSIIAFLKRVNIASFHSNWWCRCREEMICEVFPHSTSVAPPKSDSHFVLQVLEMLLQSERDFSFFWH